MELKSIFQSKIKYPNTTLGKDGPDVLGSSVKEIKSYL
jgi:hypothetical protein